MSHWLHFTFFFWNSPTLFTSLHNVDCKVERVKKRAFFKFINSIYCFFVLCCSLLNKQQAQKLSVHSHKTNEKKIEKKSSFLLVRSLGRCVDNQCSWILKRNKKKPSEKNEKHDRHFPIRPFTSMWHFACHLISVSFNWKREFNNFI